MTNTTTALFSDDLARADSGSWYTIAGVGGPLTEWTGGYELLLLASEVGLPTGWFTTTGESVNAYAQSNGADIADRDLFNPALTFLMFPLDGLDVGRLAMFRLDNGDRWFDDMVANMRRA